MNHYNHIALILIVILLAGGTFFSGAFVFFGKTPSNIVGNLTAQFVGMTVGIAPNPDNILAQQLKEKETALKEKELYIQEKENELYGIVAENSNRNNRLFYAVFGIGAVLSFLILLNFYFDYRHKKIIAMEQGKEKIMEFSP